jgi:hypothetical protein
MEKNIYKIGKELIVDDIKVRYSGEEADLWCSYKIGFGDGYNKAKETYQFTEEDIFGLKDLLQNTSPLMFEVVARNYIKNIKTKTIFYE